MSNTPHDLHAEFPEYAEAITALKTSDSRFARLAAQYHEVNDMIHRAETNIDPMEDLAMIDLRKTRGRLRDDIYAALKAAQPTS